jgi:hypothetical protein
VCLISHTEVFLMLSAELWPRLMEIVPSDVHYMLCVSWQTGSVYSGCALVYSYLSSWNTSQRSVYWALWMWKLCSKYKFVILISSKYAVVSFVYCMPLFTLKARHITWYACLISPNMCCPNFALCGIRPSDVSASPFNKAELIVTDGSKATQHV